MTPQTIAITVGAWAFELAPQALSAVSSRMVSARWHLPPGFLHFGYRLRRGAEDHPR